MGLIWRFWRPFIYEFPSFWVLVFVVYRPDTGLNCHIKVRKEEGFLFRAFFWLRLFCRTYKLGYSLSPFCQLIFSDFSFSCAFRLFVPLYGFICPDIETSGSKTEHLLSFYSGKYLDGFGVYPRLVFYRVSLGKFRVFTS